MTDRHTSIRASQLRNFSITAEDLQNNSITGDKLIDNTVSGSKLATTNSPTDGYYLKYTTASGMGWAEVGAGVSDHGNLTGLSDDDHTQYLLADGSRSLTGDWNFGLVNISGTGKAIFDPAFLGEIGTGYAGFCYIGNDNYSDYAMLQDSNGATYINASTGQNITLRNNNSTIMSVLSTGVQLNSGVIVLPNGTSINEFSIDGALAGNSDDAVPTEKAVKTYVDASSGGIPVGSVITHVTGVPTGYLPCDGSAVSRATYSDLFNILGIMYGNGDGSSTFNIPDMRGYFLRGHDNGAGNDPDAASRTDRGDGTTGDYVGTKQANENKAHNHTASSNTTGNHHHTLNDIWILTNAAGTANYQGTGGTHLFSNSYISYAGDHSHTITVNSNGGNESRPININVQFCIKY